MSWADADKVRKIIGKKKDASEFDVYKDQFITGASKHITPEDAQKLWHDFEAHAG
jgi:DNA polymerase III alpha subunit